MSASKTNEAILNELERLGGTLQKEDSVRHHDEMWIALPPGMTPQSAARFLALKHEEDEAPTNYARTFKYRPWDGGVALVNAMNKMFGMVQHGREHPFFGREPSDIITIPVGVNETVQVPWGAIQVPLLPGLTLFPDETYDAEYGKVFEITGQGPRKYAGKVEGIFNAVQMELDANSIYRGKAFNGAETPEFIDLDAIDFSKIAFPQETMIQLEAKVFSQIRYADTLNDLGVNRKRAVLLDGEFGTGKTTLGMAIGQEAIAHGRTFVYAEPGKHDLEEVFRTARMLQPSVVFFEDLDTVDDDPGKSISSLLDLFDGIKAKNTEVLAIMTTNYPEAITAGMRRPGRLDAQVHLGLPDAGVIEKIVRNNVPEELLSDVNWVEVTDSMEGYLPAFVMEAAQQSIRYSVTRNSGEVGNVTTEDIVNSAEGLRDQFEGMKDAPHPTPADTLGQVVSNVVEEAADTAIRRRFP